MNKLTELANKYFTDKGTIAYEAHGYTEEYSKYIPDNGKYTLLEIGYWHGDSARMWKEYNPEANLVFIDIDKNALNYQEGGRYALYIGDATNKELIDEIVENCEIDEISGFDFIIDDGSHKYDDILASFKLLYPKLKSGGYYFIEDLHAGQAEKHRLMEDILELYPFKNLGFRCNGKLWIIQKP